MQSELTTLLNVESEMLQNWVKTNLATATSTANNQSIRETIQSLVEQPSVVVEGQANTSDMELRRLLERQLSPTLSSHDFAGYVVADKSQRIVAAATAELVGREMIRSLNELLESSQREATITPPFGSVVLLRDETGRLRSGVPTMLACAPVRNTDFQVIGVLAFEFDRSLILQNS